MHPHEGRPKTPARALTGTISRICTRSKLIKMGNMPLAGENLIGEMKIAFGRLDILMPHDVHKLVNIDPALLLHVVNTIVCGKIMPELMRRELKRDDAGELRNHELYRITGQRITVPIQKKPVAGVRTKGDILLYVLAGTGAHGDSTLLIALPPDNHPVIGEGEPGAQQSADLSLAEAAVIHKRDNGAIAGGPPFTFGLNGIENQENSLRRVNTDFTPGSFRNANLLSIAGNT